MRSKCILIVLSVVAAMAAVAVVVSAGNPDNPPGPPETTYSYSLEDIYDRLDSGAAGAQSAFTEPGSGPPTGTMYTLNEIMAVAPQVDGTNGATAAQVMSGRTYWGLQSGAWGLQTGTMPDNGAVSLVPTTMQQAIAMGYHNGSGTVAGDAGLVSGNVRSGASIFGVAGDPNVVNTASGDAAAADILSGRVAWVDGSEVTGSMPDNGAVTLTPATTQQTIVVGYHDGSGYVAGDADLTAGNIKGGVSVFGVDGTLYGPLPRTGQTTSYATGDDGDLEVGVAWPGPRFITGTTGVVTDTLTGLIWLEHANCFGLRTWAQALADANTLNSGECGLGDSSVEGDWRLPSAQELQSLVHYGVFDPAVPNTAGTGKWSEGDPFTAVRSDSYWSSSTMAASASYAWNVPMGDGSVRGNLKTLQYSVWPVRGGR
jgi:hypothetical protein